MTTATSFGTSLLLAGIFLSPVSLHATSVVALIDKANHTLVIAADCRVSLDPGSASDCKIIDHPGCTVAIAGLYAEKTTPFRLREIVDAACQQPGDLRVKADAFLRLAKAPYERAAHRIREVDPVNFRKTVENKPTEVIFAGLHDGRLTLFVRGLVADANGRATTERYQSTDTADSPIGYLAGLNRHIREYVNSHSHWEGLGYRDVARQFVEMEIKANPDLAGPPISELEINGRGAVRWISRGACDASEAD